MIASRYNNAVPKLPQEASFLCMMATWGDVHLLSLTVLLIIYILLLILLVLKQTISNSDWLLGTLVDGMRLQFTLSKHGLWPSHSYHSEMGPQGTKAEEQRCRIDPRSNPWHHSSFHIQTECLKVLNPKWHDVSKIFQARNLVMSHIIYISFIIFFGGVPCAGPNTTKQFPGSLVTSLLSCVGNGKALSHWRTFEHLWAVFDLFDLPTILAEVWQIHLLSCPG